MRVTLLVVQGHPQGKHLFFPPGNYYFGRGAECQVRPNSAMISRQHCLLRISETAVSLRDLGSRNGTLVNGVLISTEQELKIGDQFQIGQLVFELLLVDRRTAQATTVIPGSGPVTGAETVSEAAPADLQDIPGPTEETEDSHTTLSPQPED